MRLNPRHTTPVRSPKPHRRAGRRPAGDRPLLLEPLETRTMPSVTFHPGQYQLPQVTNEIIPNVNTFVTEPLVTINPINPANIVVSTQNWLQVSTNGGGSFTTARSFPQATGLSSDGDTATAFDSTGRLFWANLAAYAGSRVDVEVTEVNPTTGAQIGNTVLIPNPGGVPADKEFLAADANPNSPNRDNLYLSFGEYISADNQYETFFSRSTDHGQTWSTPTRLSTQGGPNDEGWTWPSSVTVDTGGRVYVAYHSLPLFNDSDIEGSGTTNNPVGSTGQVLVRRSDDGGATFFAATAAFSQSKADVTFNKQDAANASFTTIAGAKFWTSGSAQPWILADPARPGNIYVIAANRTHIPGGPPDPNDPADVVFTRSTDGGVTWSNPTIVDEGTTVPGTTHNSFQLFPTAAIDQNGNIVVAWYDNRRGLTNSGGDYKLDVFARYSTDAGDTWSDAFQVNTTSFDPDPGAQTRFAGPPATTRIGEYFGIAMSNGMAYVDWNDNIFDNTGKATGQQVYLAAFQINGTLEVDQPNDVFRHKLTIDQLPGAPGNNFLEILDTTLSSPATTQRVYLGMGDFLGSLTVNDASHASDVIDIEKTFFGDNVHVNFTAQGGTVGVCLGNQDLDNIAGNIDIFSGFGFGSALAVNDALDPNPGDAWTLSFQNVSRFGSGNIHYDGMDSFSVRGGDQGAKFDVETTTSATATSLTTGLGADEVDVRATNGAAPLSIDNAGGADTVTIGSLAPATGGTLAGIQSPVTVTSSGGSSHLILDDSGDATGETVTAGPGTITGLAPAEIDYTPGQVSVSILGGTGDDTFRFGPGGSIPGNVDGGGGRNTLDYSADGGVEAIVDLQAGTASLVGGGFANIQRLVGTGNGADTLVAPDAATTWDVTGADAGDVNGVFSFSGVANLQGGAANDIFKFGPAGSASGAVDGGGGTNTLDYSADGGAAATVNLQTAAASRVSGGLAGGFGHIQRMVGSTAGGDRLVGPGTAGIWTVAAANAGNRNGTFTFAGVENLVGGAANDTFRFGPGGSVSGSVDGGGGTNVLDYSADGGAAATVNLQTAAASRIKGGAAGGFSHVQRVVGSSSAADTLAGGNTASTWTISGANAGNINGVFTFAAVKNLLGGSANDTFRFSPAGSITGTVNGGGGSNTLDYSADGGAAATVNLQTAAASRIKGGTAGGFSHVQRVVGSSSAADTLVGANTANTWTITAANAGNISGVFTFAGVKNLLGGSAVDTFRFGPGGSITGSVNGGGGSDRLDYSPDGGAAATVNLQTSAASRIRSGGAGGFANIHVVVGSTATSDRLIGTNAATLWQITGSNAGMAGAVAFSGIENVQGGTASDTFRFSPNGSLSGSLNGGGGGDWLDYSLFTTSVSVNLATGAASRVGGFAAGKVSQIRNVVGGAGNDTLVGNALGNILMGGGGNDTITAGSGRSVLIGGTGGDILKGGPADDLLIAGTTNFDGNHAALMSILAEWQRTDKTYAQRIADLKNGGGLNGTTKLIWGTTVHDDGAADTLTGGPGLDWFFANLGPGGVLDHITDRNNGGPEQVN